MAAEVVYDKDRLAVVPIGAVAPNTWNPKVEGTPEFDKVVRSLEANGLRIPLVVREVGKGKYEVLDGMQRLAACQQLGMTQVVVYNEGKVDDARARELTLWYQQQVPFDELMLAQLVTTMLGDYPDVLLPYTEAELADMKALVDFDWDSYGKGGDGAGGADPDPEPELVDFTCAVTPDVLKLVHKALDKVREAEGEKLSDGRALELVCADYLAGA